MKLAADIIEHKGPGQRRNRNRLAFLAADQAALEDIQNVVRKKLAWASIVRDARGILQLPPAQEDDAKKKLAEQETAAPNALRRGWKHLLLPQETQPASPNAARGFDLEPVALTNRGSDLMPLAQLAWKKCEDDGLIVARLGVLDNDLGKVWQPTQPHVSVRQLRDWFAMRQRHSPGLWPGAAGGCRGHCGGAPGRRAAGGAAAARRRMREHEELPAPGVDDWSRI